MAAQLDARELRHRARQRLAVGAQDGRDRGRSQEGRLQSDHRQHQHRHSQPASDMQPASSRPARAGGDLHADDAAEHHRRHQQDEAEAAPDDEGDEAVGRTKVDGIDGGPIGAQASDLEGHTEGDRCDEHSPAGAQDEAAGQAYQHGPHRPACGVRGRDWSARCQPRRDDARHDGHGDAEQQAGAKP